MWKADLRRMIRYLQPVHYSLADRLWIAASCSLMHIPVSLANDHGIDPEVRPWLPLPRKNWTNCGSWRLRSMKERTLSRPRSMHQEHRCKRAARVRGSSTMRCAAKLQA